MMNKKIMIMGVISVIALAITGFVLAQSYDSGELQLELDSLISELNSGGYGWLVNYSGDDLSSSVEVYLPPLGDDSGEPNVDNEPIAVFESITNESWYKVYLTSLEGSHDTFDLKVVSEGGGVEFDYIVDPIAVRKPGEEIISKRTENSKTFDLGNKRRMEISMGPIHYKNDYSDLSEQWKDIDLTIKDGKLTTAPYELTIDGKKLTFRDKKTGEVSTLELLNVFPPGLQYKIVPSNEGVSFQHILPTDKISFQAQFRVTGKVQLRTRAFDDDGELELEASLVNDILTENLPQVKDKETGQARAAVGNIRIDPTLTVQPSGKDNYVSENYPTSNYGSSAAIRVYNKVDQTERSILEFDISGLPAATLGAASLQLYYYSYGYTNPVDKTVRAYKLTRTDWIEGTYENPSTSGATWNDYKIIGETHYTWTAAGGDYVTFSPVGGSTTFPAAVSAWMAWDVLAIVQDAYDGSIAAEFLVRHGAEGLSEGYSLARFWSNDYTTDTSLRPKLVIDYTEPGTNMQVNIGDVWKEISAAQINIGDTWKAVEGIQINIGDTWKTIM